MKWLLFGIIVGIVIWLIRVIRANTPKATMKRCYETLKSGRYGKTTCGYCYLFECLYSKECESDNYILD